MSQYKKFAINNYVLYRYKEEWLECRIKDIIQTDKTEYKLLLFILKYNITNPELILDEQVYKSSFENEKKFKIQKTYKLPQFFLNFLREDKIKIKNNFIVKLIEENIKKPGRKPKNLAKEQSKSVKNIIADFKTFLGLNKIIFEEELEEVEMGFNYLFNKVIYNLLYDKELLKFGQITMPYEEVYGVEHLVRLLYFCEGKNDVLCEYAYYFCDFLDLNYKKYFLDRQYEELK